MCAQRRKGTKHQPAQREHSFPVPFTHALHALHLINDKAPPACPQEGAVAPEELLVGREADIAAARLSPLLWAAQVSVWGTTPMPCTNLPLHARAGDAAQKESISATREHRDLLSKSKFMFKEPKKRTHLVYEA